MGQLCHPIVLRVLELRQLLVKKNYVSVMLYYNLISKLDEPKRESTTGPYARTNRKENLQIGNKRIRQQFEFSSSLKCLHESDIEL